MPNFVPLPCAACGAEPGSPGDPGGGGCPNGSATVVRLCDITAEACTPFLRHIAYTCEGIPTGYTDTLPDGMTPFTPTGAVGDCAPCEEESPGEPCVPTPMCPRLTGISGPDQWVMPPGTESMTISVVCGPITITDCAGETTVLGEGCGTLTWSAPAGDPCNPVELCAPFVVDIPAGSAVYINWLEPCGGTP